MDINEIFSKLGELLSYGEYDKVASVCERLISTGYKEKEIHLVKFLAEAEVKDINDLPDSEKDLDKLKSYDFIIKEFDSDMANYVMECNDYIHSRKMAELDSLTKEDTVPDDSSSDDTDDDLGFGDVKSAADSRKESFADDLRDDDGFEDSDKGFYEPESYNDSEDYERDQKFSGGVERFGGSEDRFSLEEDRYTPRSSRYETIGDEYNDQYGDQYSDDQYSNQYGEYEDDEFDMPKSRKKKKNKRANRYEDEYNDQYGDQYSNQYGDQYEDDDYDDLDEEGSGIDFVLFIIAVVLGVADIASLVFALISGVF